MIDLDYDKINDYIKLLFATWDKNNKCYKYVNVQVRKPKYCKDLFIYLLKYNFLDNGKIN